MGPVCAIAPLRARRFGDSLPAAGIRLSALGALLAAFGTSPLRAETAAEPVIPTFHAHYTADWKTINVGTSDLDLQPDEQPDSYVYTWTVTARGVFRIVYSNDVIQKSWFRVIADHVRPQRYHAEDGAATANIDFDWEDGRARGMVEKKPVELKLSEGLQDVMSIQVEVMLDLQNRNLPKIFHIVDKDEIKDFVYTEEGPAKLRTALGQLDTLVVSSQRNGSNRVLRMWFAPSLGFVPVQAERLRDGKLEFAMRIKTFEALRAGNNGAAAAPTLKDGVA